MYCETLKKGETVGNIIFESDKLLQAYSLAYKSHEGQKRKSGEPYFNHCIEVSKILHDEWGIKKENYLIGFFSTD